MSSSSRGSIWKYGRYTQGSRRLGRRGAGERGDNTPTSGMTTAAVRWQPLGSLSKGLSCAFLKGGIAQGEKWEHGEEAPAGYLAGGSAVVQEQWGLG